MKTNNKNIKKIVSAGQIHQMRKDTILDPFLDDALEGFENSTIEENDFSRLDKKMNIKNIWKITFSLTLLILIIGISLVLFKVVDRNPKRVISKDKINKVEKHQKQILTKSEANEFLPVQIVKNQKKLQSFIAVEQTKSQEITPKEKDIEKINYHPKIDPLSHKLTERFNDAKETYIHDFKVIDYRYYRKKPIPVKQEIETGIPANYENTNNQQSDPKNTLSYSYMNYLGKALLQFSKGKYNESLVYFQEICETYPDDANALFYGALAAYNIQDFNKSEAMLNQLSSNRFTNFEEARMWYLCLIYKATGNHVQFIDYKKTIINKQGFYSQKAAKLED